MGDCDCRVASERGSYLFLALSQPQTQSQTQSQPHYYNARLTTVSKSGLANKLSCKFFSRGQNELEIRYG